MLSKVLGQTGLGVCVEGGCLFFITFMPEVGLVNAKITSVGHKQKNWSYLKKNQNLDLILKKKGRRRRRREERTQHVYEYYLNDGL